VRSSLHSSSKFLWNVQLGSWGMYALHILNTNRLWISMLHTTYDKEFNRGNTTQNIWIWTDRTLPSCDLVFKKRQRQRPWWPNQQVNSEQAILSRL
jgi:hypothetical protein